MITREMVERQAAQMSCEAAAIMAVAEVESASSGFLPDGRPAILFEALWFHTFTNGAFDAAHPSISSPVWDRSLYRGGAGEYGRLAESQQLDSTAALKSASWGAFQIMGFNYTACGYPTVEQFVTAMRGDIENHLAAFDAFVRSNGPMLVALRQKDWTTFARLYNGPGAVAQYATKISATYAIHARELAAAPKPSLEQAVPPAPAPLPPPVITGPPIPDHDATTPPPAGYVETSTGKVVRTDVTESGIFKKSTNAAIVTAASTATSVGTAIAAFKDLDYKLILALGAVGFVAGITAIAYNLLTRRDRVQMHQQGIA